MGTTTIEDQRAEVRRRIEQLERGRRVLPHVQHPLPPQDQEVGGAEGVEAEEEGPIRGQLGGVPLHEHMLKVAGFLGGSVAAALPFAGYEEFLRRGAEESGIVLVPLAILQASRSAIAGVMALSRTAVRRRYAQRFPRRSPAKRRG